MSFCPRSSETGPCNEAYFQRVVSFFYCSTAWCTETKFKQQSYLFSRREFGTNSLDQLGMEIRKAD